MAKIKQNEYKNSKLNADEKDKEMTSEEKYKILYEAYADEIKNLWQRSVFLSAFMVLVWTGYGALQLKFIEKSLEIQSLSCTAVNFNAYHIASFGLCFIIIALSLLWIAMAKGSKFVQEAHEWHILNNNKVEIRNTAKNLFCNLNDYEYYNEKDSSTDTESKEMNKNLYSTFFRKGALRAYRYSPSKINIALGWFSAVVAFALSMVHTYIAFITDGLYGINFVFVVILWLLIYFIKKHTKGGNKDKKLTLWTLKI